MSILDLIESSRQNRRQAQQRQAVKYFAVGAAAGIFLGAAAAALLVPKNGQENREKFSRKAREIVEKAKAAVEEKTAKHKPENGSAEDMDAVC